MTGGYRLDYRGDFIGQLYDQLCCVDQSDEL